MTTIVVINQITESSLNMDLLKLSDALDNHVLVLRNIFHLTNKPEISKCALFMKLG